MDKISVCVLAHNEQKNIEKTLKNIYACNPEIDFDLKVYANGCTDRTVQTAMSLMDSIPHLEIHDLPIASKPLAWNTAFFENPHDILIFSDADIQVDQGTVRELCVQLGRDRSAVIVSSTMHPFSAGLPLNKRLVAFMQIPLAQDFLYGGFYALRRNALARIFRDLNINGMPQGIVGEDVFLERIVGAERLRVSSKKCYYEPPNTDEYCAYLARVAWQNRQVKTFFKKSYENGAGPGGCKKERLSRKLRLLAASSDRSARVFSFFSRSLFKGLFARRISSFARAMGPLTNDGASILAGISRAKSCK